MNIVLAEISDASIIHDLMMRAFDEYKYATPPTSALAETVQTITTAMEDGEKAFIGYIEDEAVAMIRFRVDADQVYFYRFSVVPEKRGQGLAKEMLRFLEDYANEQKKPMLVCKVRAEVGKNISLYESIGYEVFDEELLHREDGTRLAVVSMKKMLS